MSSGRILPLLQAQQEAVEEWVIFHGGHERGHEQRHCMHHSVMTSEAAATVNKASMTNRKPREEASTSKCDADYARCSFCDAKRKASSGNTSEESPG
ncbi:hypothetical protein AMECASPLE_024705 [Ameca splendens]|uniref:Uncharacterized protein n=1 Tax=Ameca splendens TaxID=208324 RepID=A0ABV0Y4R7_9TELE